MNFSTLLATPLLNNLSDYVSILNSECQFMQVNHQQTHIMGYKKDTEILGRSYDRFKNISSSIAEVFLHEDKTLLKNNQPIRYLSYHLYCDGKWHLLLGDKSCIFHNEKPVGIFSQARDMTTSRLIDFSRFLFEENKKYAGKIGKNGFDYIISEDNTTYNLSNKEMVVLFYFLRGKSAREIANIIVRSEKTINMHIESIKNKFSVASKSALIEKAIFEGFANIIPESLM